MSEEIGEIIRDIKIRRMNRQFYWHIMGGIYKTKIIIPI